jgi:unspecific monooxygenase
MNSLFGPAMLDEYAKRLETIAANAIETWPRNTPFSLLPRIQEVILEGVMELVFGPPLKDSRAYEEAKAAFVRGCRLASAAALFAPILRTNWGRWSLGWRLEECARTVRQFIATHVARARESTRNDESGILLRAMLEGRAAGYFSSDDELFDEIASVLLGGVQSTAVSIAWTVAHIMTDAALRESLISEDSPASHHGSLLDSTCKESLRLHPIVPIVIRRVRQPFVVGGVSIKPGDFVLPCAFLTHRRADVYGAPHQFIADRFLNATPAPYEFVPFGGGARRCVGQALALLQLRTGVLNIISRRQIQAVDVSLPASRRYNITMAPRGGVRLLLKRA